MNPAPHKSRRAFTLVEALVTTAIISLVLTLVTVMFQFIVQHYTKTSSDLDAEREARLAMANVTDIMREAQVNPALAQPTPPATPVPPVSFPVMPPGTPPPSPTPAGTTTFTIAEQPTSANYASPTPLPYDTVTISLGTPPPGHAYGDLQETINGSAPMIIGHDIKTFQVLPVFQNVYDITITTAPMTFKGQPALPYSLNSRVFLSYYLTNSNNP